MTSIIYWKCKGLECFCTDGFHSCNFRDKHGRSTCSFCSADEEDDEISIDILKNSSIVLMDEKSLC